MNPIKLLTYPEITAIETRAKQAPADTALQRQLRADLKLLIAQWHGLYTRITAAQMSLEGSPPDFIAEQADAFESECRRQASGNGGGQRT